MKHKFIAKKYWNNISTPMGESGNLINKYDDIINFSLGDLDFTTPEIIIEKAFEDAKAGHTHYTNSFGYEELRDEICNYYREDFGFELKKDEIMVTTSGCHAMWLVLEAILDPGDEVIIPNPFFTPYEQQVELCGGKAVFLPTYEEELFEINVERMEKLITNRTKALILNTPNNPTGTCFRRETLEAIANFAKKYDLIVIADDIYTAFSFDTPFIPIASLDGMKERTITIGSFSKNYAMTGWRIGYIAASDFIVEMVNNINENNVFTAPSISQRAAIYALRERKNVVPHIVDTVKKRMKYAYSRISNIPRLSCLPPRGSIYIFMNIKDTGLSSKEFCDLLLKEAHIVAIPGNAFGSQGEGFVRLALTIDIELLEEAFDRIERLNILKAVE